MKVTTLIAVLLATWICHQTRAADNVAAGNVYVKLLLRHGIATDAPSLKRYLSSIAGDKERDKNPRRLIKELGDDDFYVRQAATRQLKRIPTLPQDLLKEAAKAADPQVKWRAESLMLKRGRDGERPDQILHAALRVIVEKQIYGFTRDLLRLAPHCTEPFLEEALIVALNSTANPAGKIHLDAALRDAHPARRRIAVFALHRIDGEKSRERLLTLLNDKDDSVLLAVARTLAESGDAACLPALVNMLRAKDEAVRAASAKLLRSVTGQRFAFDPAASVDERETSVAAWRAWSKNRAADLKLKPLPTKARIVLCLERGAFIGLDAKQDVAWKIEEISKWQFRRIYSPSGVVRLPNGNLMISSRSMGQVFEITTAGELVGNFAVGEAYSLQRLQNGNLLVSMGSRKKVAEVTPKGKIVWEAKVRELAGQSLRLADGHTLVAIHNLTGLVELNSKGEMVREWEGVPVPSSIRRLTNGNLLMTSYDGKVLEYTRDGQLVSSIAGLAGVRDAVMLESGNYLVALPAGVREVDRDGATVLERKVGNVSRLLVEH